MAQQQHAVKEVLFLGRKVPVLLQGSEGPCALLAIGARPVRQPPALTRRRAANVLLLRNSLQIKARNKLSSSELLSLVASKLLDQEAVRLLPPPQRSLTPVTRARAARASSRSRTR